MSSARDEILGKIRRSVGSSPPSLEYAGLPRDYHQSGALNAEDRIALFEDRLRDYNATVYRCSEQELPQTILDAILTRRKRSLVIPNGFPRNCLPGSIQFRTDESLTYSELDQIEGVLTACALAIAMTGTLVLRHTEREGRRALTLIPDYHLCIVYANQIVETLVEGIRQMASLAEFPLTTISGPSATSDIEMIRVPGVHGPRVLDVVVVDRYQARGLKI